VPFLNQDYPNAERSRQEEGRIAFVKEIGNKLFNRDDEAAEKIKIFKGPNQIFLVQKIRIPLD